ncbi:hypothetical protein Pint_03719 [Pistacia integerrima]|uniref:Uncharacterized protein n=1 Tax=Pistacia integerrima TaxID=434235 RepID=A0ACC0Z3V6_9ROSI|nr:hypothetical protein Pint_03719 [Pistacia integerrima]
MAHNVKSSTSTTTKLNTSTNKIDHGKNHKKIVTSSSAPDRALTQPKPRQAMTRATATSKSTTTDVTIKSGHGVEVEVEMVTEETVINELDAADMKQSFAKSLLGFIRTCSMLGGEIAVP